MSEKPVAERLQVKKGRRLAVIGASPDLDAIVGAVEKRAEPAVAEVILVFVWNRATLDNKLVRAKQDFNSASILWLAYPKLSSALAGDLNRDAIRALMPAYGLDIVSQIAIDEDWSALRLKRVS